MIPDEPVVGTVGKLTLGPDDVLVLRSEGHLGIDEVERLRRRVVDALAPNKPGVLILTGGLEISTLRLDQCPSEFVNDLVTKVARRMADHLRTHHPQ